MSQFPTPCSKILENEAATHAFAAQIAQHVKIGDVITLFGILGAGKTAFARGFIRHLAGENIEVISPTFPLVQDYVTPQGTIFHMDLYRLRSAEELVEVGLEHAMKTGISLIEWPEIALHLLPPRRLEIVFEHCADGSRSATLRNP